MDENQPVCGLKMDRQSGIARRNQENAEGPIAIAKRSTAQLKFWQPANSCGCDALGVRYPAKNIYL
jgi:hypothetical protein